MKATDLGVLSYSFCNSFTPSALAQRMLFYLTWCGHYYCTAQYKIQRESFPAILLAYVCHGTLHVKYGETEFKARKGDVVLLDCRKPHFYRADKQLEFLYANFAGANSFDICDYLLKENGPLIQKKFNRLIAEALENLVDFYQNKHVESMTATSERVFHFFDILLSPDSDDSVKMAIYHTIQYIQDNVGKNITLQELATIARMSTYHFAHIFKKETGFSPIEYVINTRIDQAKVLLLRTTNTIEEISYQLGYTASSSFITIFIKKTGMTPSAYRTRC